MPAAGFVSMDKGQVMMCLALAELNRKEAAKIGGISERTFRRMMRRHRVRAPRANAKLSAEKVKRIRLLLEKHSQQEVAAMENVHPHTIGMIARYETWYWVQ